MALLVKIGPDKAEAEGFGGSNLEADNTVWPDLTAAHWGSVNQPYARG
jgi:hypothetical protein